MLLGRMSLGRVNRPSSVPFFSVRAIETKSFTRVEDGVLVSLGNKGTGVFPGDEKIFSGSSPLKNSVSQSVESTNSSSSGSHGQKLHLGAMLGTRVSLTLSGTSKHTLPSL